MKTDPPAEATCYVCQQAHPISELQDCGLGIYRCKTHRPSTILRAGKRKEKEKGGSGIMKEIKLISLALKDFQGGTFTLGADGNDTDVYGANSTGKTRLASAFSWLLFGKDSLGRSDFEIKNLDSQGNVAERGLEHTVEGVFSVDGEEITLKKVYSEKFVKQRGRAEAVFSGHTAVHYINGVRQNETEYKAFITGMAGAEETFLLLTNPMVFPALPWQRQRSILLEVCGDITDAQVIATDEALAPLTDLLKRYTVSKSPLDDLKKVVTGRRTEINKQIDQLPVRIDEVRRGLPDVTGLNLSDLNVRKLALEDFISACQLKLQGIDNGAGIAELSKQLKEVSFEIGQLENKYYLEGMRHVTRLNSQINELSAGKEAEERQVKDLKDEILTKQNRLAGLNTDLEQLRAQWTEIDGEEFLDATEMVCYACGQPLPPERVEDTRTKALAAFNRSKAERLLEIETKGKAAAAERDKAKEQIEDLHGKIQSIPTYEPVDLDGFIAERDALKAKAEDYSLIPGRAELLEQKAAIEKRIEESRAGLSQDKDVLQKEVDDLTAQLKEVKEKADRFTRREQGEKRIEELKAEEKKLSKEYEELEKQLFLIETFIKTKVSLLTDRINSLFEIVRFKLYDIQVNGGLAECCVATVGGVPYDSGLNSAARTQAGLDIIRTLQRHYKVAPPVFIDNRESCTVIPAMDCQVLSLYVSPEDKVLRVEKASEGKRVAA